LVRAEDEGDVLSGDELVAMILVLLVAGHETTTNLIASGVLALLEHPDQLERLRSNPALIKSAVEELLRYACPLGIATERYAREDVAIGRVTIPRGELVGVVLASANRDERQFPDPGFLDIAREPNRHLSFGLGTHFCLGAALARLEAQIAIGTLLRRLPALRLGAPLNTLHWRRGALLRGLEALSLEFGPE
jgi:cytochrome P450 PksS